MLHTRPAPRPPQRYPVRIKVTYLQQKRDSFIAARNQVHFRLVQFAAITQTKAHQTHAFPLDIMFMVVTRISPTIWRLSPGAD